MAFDLGVSQGVIDGLRRECKDALSVAEFDSASQFHADRVEARLSDAADAALCADFCQSTGTGVVVFHVARFDRAVEAARQHIDRLKRSVTREKKPAPSSKAALDAVCAALNSAVESGGNIDLDALRSALNTRK